MASRESTDRVTLLGSVLKLEDAGERRERYEHTEGRYCVVHRRVEVWDGQMSEGTESGCTVCLKTWWVVGHRCAYG